MVRCTRRALPLTDGFLLVYSCEPGSLFMLISILQRGIFSCYNISVAKLQTATGRRCYILQDYSSFWKAVMVEVTAYYFCKWLDVAFKYFFQQLASLSADVQHQKSPGTGTPWAFRVTLNNYSSFACMYYITKFVC